MTACPSVVATSLPGRDSWALEEFMDTVTSADPGAIIRTTEYRGVFVAISSKDPVSIAARFLSYTHAFLARVYPVMFCDDAGRLGELVDSLARALSGRRVKLEIRLREPVSTRLREEDVRSLLLSKGLETGRTEIVVIFESLQDKLLGAYGTQHRCGPRCRVFLPLPWGRTAFTVPP